MANIEYTKVDDNVFVCDNCGAHAEDPREVKHHATCRPGESKKWEEFYNNADITNGDYLTTEKVLIHDEAPTEIHLVGGNFITAERTICGERLHSISSVHIINDDIPVTCKKCKELCHE